MCFGLGILSARHVVLSPLLSLSLLVALMLGLWASVQKRRSRASTAVFSCLMFVTAGHLRALFPDISLVPDGLLRASAGWSEALSLRIHALGLSADGDTLVQAMLLGRRQDLSSGLRTLYNQVGAGHVLALSGLHVGVLFLLLNALLLRLLTWPGPRRWVGGAIILLLWLYVVLTGCSPSLVRAAVMVSLMTVSLVRQSGFSSWHTLGVAALAILFFSPSALWSVSFQLSFSAVAGIFLFYRMNGKWAERSLPVRWFRNGVTLSLSAQLGCMPLVVYYFHTLSLSSVLLSPLYILLATCILYLALLALLAGKMVAPLLSFFIGLQHGLMRWVASVPLLASVDLSLSAFQVVLVYLSALFFVAVLRVEECCPYGSLMQDRPYRFLRLWPLWLAALLFAMFAVLLFRFF